MRENTPPFNPCENHSPMQTKPLDPPSRPLVVGYVRGSTDDQQNTLVAQRTQIEGYCGFKQFNLGRVFVDEGESAVKLDFYERPLAAQMVAWMKENGATAIIITKLDRGFRGAVDLLLTIDDLKTKGIGMHLLDIGLDPTTPVGEMVATMMASVARYECRRRSERQREAVQAMKDTNQRTGAVSYGWDAITSTRTSKTGRQADDLVANPKEQMWLRQIIEWSDGGVSDCEIARRLNNLNVLTKNAGKPIIRKGKATTCQGKWAPASVQSVREHARLDSNPSPLTASLRTLAAA